VVVTAVEVAAVEVAVEKAMEKVAVTAAEAMVAAAAESMAMAAEVTAGRHTLRTLSKGRLRRRWTSCCRR